MHQDHEEEESRFSYNLTIEDICLLYHCVNETIRLYLSAPARPYHEQEHLSHLQKRLTKVFLISNIETYESIPSPISRCQRSHLEYHLDVGDTVGKCEAYVIYYILGIDERESHGRLHDTPEQEVLLQLPMIDRDSEGP